MCSRTSTQDDRDDEGVLDPNSLEEGSSEIEDEVDTSCRNKHELAHMSHSDLCMCVRMKRLTQLLHDLNRSSNERSMQITTLLQSTSEAIQETSRSSTIGDLLPPAIDQLIMLLDDERRGLWLTAESREGLKSAVHIVLHDEITRGFWEEAETDAEDESPCELESDGDPVGTCVLAVLGTEVHACREEDADCDGELVAKLV